MREGVSKAKWENSSGGERGRVLHGESEEDIMCERVCERDILRVRKRTIGRK